jgi:MAF protein
MVEVVLASKSPRRQALLRNLIDHFIVVSSDIDESIQFNEDPAEFVLRLAREKAINAGDKLAGKSDLDMFVIGADTIVLDGQEILGKPSDETDARRILKQLRGKKHYVLSGINLYDPKPGKSITRLVKSDVSMRSYTDDEIQQYIKSGDPFDKAGAYAIQNKTFNPVPDMDDCYANVMGLPLCDLSVLLKKTGLEIHQNVAINCQESLDYRCPVFRKRLLSG